MADSFPVLRADHYNRAPQPLETLKFDRVKSETAFARNVPPRWLRYAPSAGEGCSGGPDLDLPPRELITVNTSLASVKMRRDSS